MIPTDSEEIGFPSAMEGGAAGSGEKAMLPLLDALATYRDNVRDLARQKKGEHMMKLERGVRKRNGDAHPIALL